MKRLTAKGQFEYWRGQRYEDSERIIEVVALRGKLVGIKCTLKAKPENTVKFSMSEIGAKVLVKNLTKVLHGDLTRWKTPIKMVWTIASSADAARRLGGKK